MKKKTKRYDVFISYRRVGGYETAQAVKLFLEKHHYRVFLDVEALRQGPFNESLYQVIEQTPSYVIILNQGSLDRCFESEDWVYNELAYAFATKRNIVPVMLRGFDWPKTLPDNADQATPERRQEVSETIQKLSMQNGITAGPDFFSEAMVKLRKLLPLAFTRHLSFLASKMTLVFFAMLLLIGLLWGWHYTAQNAQKGEAQKAYESAASHVANLMGLTISDMSEAVRKANDLNEEWDKFYRKSLANPNKAQEYHDDLIKTIDHAKEFWEKKFKSPITPPSQEVLDTLRANGVDMADIEVWYSIILPNFRQEYLEYFDALKKYADIAVTEPSLLDVCSDFAKNHTEYIRLTSERWYYGYLCLLATLPKSVYSVRPALEKLVLCPGVNIEQPYEELDRHSKIVDQNIQNVLNKLQLPLFNEDVTNKRLEAQLDSQINALQKSYQEALEKFTFTDNDTQWQMWGKILRLSSFLRLHRGINIIPAEDIFQDIERFLDEFVQRNKANDPNVEVYAQSAKRYFRLLSQNKIDDYGILVFAIQDNQTHPFLQPGDIVVECNGQEVMLVDEFFAMGKKDAPNEIKRLRFDRDGNPDTFVYTSVPGSPAVGYIELREE